MRVVWVVVCFSRFFCWGMFLELSLFSVRRVGTCWRLCSFVVLRRRLRLVSFVAPSWQEGGDMYVLKESCPYLFVFSLFVHMFF